MVSLIDVEQKVPNINLLNVKHCVAASPVIWDGSFFIQAKSASIQRTIRIICRPSYLYSAKNFDAYKPAQRHSVWSTQASFSNSLLAAKYRNANCNITIQCCPDTSEAQRTSSRAQKAFQSRASYLVGASQRGLSSSYVVQSLHYVGLLGRDCGNE